MSAPTSQTPKGKEPVEVIEVDSDSEIDDFFRAKPRTTFSRAKVFLPHPEASNSKGLPTLKGTLPARAKDSQTTPRKRAGTVDEPPRTPRAMSGSASGDVVSLVSSDDEPGPSVPRKRSRVELTPPPELDEEEKARILAMTTEIFQVAEMSGGEEDVLPQSSPVANRGSPVEIAVRMVADPDKKLRSEKAAAHYEKRRVFTLYQDDRLDKLVNYLAKVINKGPEEMMLVYEGQRLFSLDRTPGQLGITPSTKAEMVAYEKTTWEKVQERERAERVKLFQDNTGDSLSPPPPEEDEGGVPTPVPEEGGDKLKLKVRGAAGVVRFACSSTMTVSKVCEYYSTKFELNGAKDLRLNFDGDVFRGSDTIAGMGLEDGDMVDVHYEL